jgi:hypothetical protein
MKSMVRNIPSIKWNLYGYGLIVRRGAGQAVYKENKYVPSAGLFSI